jgi:hypothetical protein
MPCLISVTLTLISMVNRLQQSRPQHGINPVGRIYHLLSDTFSFMARYGSLAKTPGSQRKANKDVLWVDGFAFCEPIT